MMYCFYLLHKINRKVKIDWRSCHYLFEATINFGEIQ